MFAQISVRGRSVGLLDAWYHLYKRVHWSISLSVRLSHRENQHEYQQVEKNLNSQVISSSCNHSIVQSLVLHSCHNSLGKTYCKPMRFHPGVIFHPNVATLCHPDEISRPYDIHVWTRYHIATSISLRSIMTGWHNVTHWDGISRRDAMCLSKGVMTKIGVVKTALGLVLVFFCAWNV